MSAAAARRRPGALLTHRGNGGVLVFCVIAAVAFVAGLLAIGGLAAGRAAEDWRGQVGGSATVVVRASGLESPEAAAARAAESLRGVKGVSAARPLDPTGADEVIARLIGGAAKGRRRDASEPAGRDLRFHAADGRRSEARARRRRA